MPLLLQSPGPCAVTVQTAAGVPPVNVLSHIWDLLCCCCKRAVTSCLHCHQQHCSAQQPLTSAHGAAAEEPHPSRDFLHALQQADKLRKDKGDSYLGVDCLFIAVLNEKDVASALADAGVGKLQIETALLDLRGKDKSKKASPHSSNDHKLAAYVPDISATLST